MQSSPSLLRDGERATLWVGDGEYQAVRLDTSRISLRRLMVVVRDLRSTQPFVDRFNAAEVYARELIGLPPMTAETNFMDLPDSVIKLEKIL